jgi:hypothetical protein
MLLEDAYPAELLRNQKNQEAVKAAVIELVGATTGTAIWISRS